VVKSSNLPRHQDKSQDEAAAFLAENLVSRAQLFMRLIREFRGRERISGNGSGTVFPPTRVESGTSGADDGSALDHGQRAKGQKVAIDLIRFVSYRCEWHRAERPPCRAVLRHSRLETAHRPRRVFWLTPFVYGLAKSVVISSSLIPGLHWWSENSPNGIPSMR